MDGNGNAVAVWVQTTSNAGAIETANLPASGSWTSPVTLSAAGASATNPTLAVNSLGDAIVGWRPTNGQILVAERRAGVWSAPISIAAAAYPGRTFGRHSPTESYVSVRVKIELCDCGPPKTGSRWSTAL